MSEARARVVQGVQYLTGWDETGKAVAEEWVAKLEAEAAAARDAELRAVINRDASFHGDVQLHQYCGLADGRWMKDRPVALLTPPDPDTA